MLKFTKNGRILCKTTCQNGKKKEVWVVFGQKWKKWTKLPKTYPKGTKVDITGKNRKKGEIISHYGPDLLKNRKVPLYLWGIV
jgi:hypothetical protein